MADGASRPSDFVQLADPRLDFAVLDALAKLNNLDLL